MIKMGFCRRSAAKTTAKKMACAGKRATAPATDATPSAQNHWKKNRRSSSPIQSSWMVGGCALSDEETAETTAGAGVWGGAETSAATNIRLKSNAVMGGRRP